MENDKSQTKHKRIRTVYFWTKKQLEMIKREAEQLAEYLNAK